MSLCYNIDMRVIHLCFSLHEPLTLRKFSSDGSEGYFAGKVEFVRENAEVYQPLFALLERNTQKFKEFRFSLMVSGLWLELAEQYDAKLIERLQKLVKLGQVELVAEPYHHSLAFFYSQDELTVQVELYRERIKKLFGVEGRIFALPELIYNDQVGKWAEEFGFAGMLVGGSPAVLGWHSPNHVYEAMECRYLRLLFRNTVLSQAITVGDSDLLAEKRVSSDSEETKLALSAQKFQKRLDLELLRGDLVNLYFDASVIRAQRERGIIGFFDDLIAAWLESRGNHFVGAAQACVVETPSLALSIKDSVSWREDVEPEDSSAEAVGVMLKSEAETQPPRWLSRPWQVELSKALYSMRREILASEDEKVINDWRKLTAIDYLQDRAESENFRLVLADLKTRAESAKKAQAVEISRTYTKKHDRGDVAVRSVVDDTVVPVTFGKPKVKVDVTPTLQTQAEVEPAEEIIPVQGLHSASVEQPVVELPEKPVDSAQKTSQKPRGIRKVIRKLVIE